MFNKHHWTTALTKKTLKNYSEQKLFAIAKRADILVPSGLPREHDLPVQFLFRFRLRPSI
jgi:hypothetical protein